MAQVSNYQKAVAELNRIARAELSGPKRHRHVWATNQRLQRGTTVLWYCEVVGCEKTKKTVLPLLTHEKG